ILLEAEAEGVAPEERLVVIGAARVEAEIAPEGAHVAQLWPGHRPGRLCERRKMLLHERMTGYGAERLGCADHELAVLLLDAAQLADLLQRDQVLRREQPVLHVRHQVRA